MSSVATLSELEAGPKRVTVDGRRYLLVAVDDGVVAYRNVCPHQYGPAIEGRIDPEAGSVFCPWHGFEFDLETGEDPRYGKALPRAEVTVEDGEVFLAP